MNGFTSRRPTRLGRRQSCTNAFPRPAGRAGAVITTRPPGKRHRGALGPVDQIMLGAMSGLGATAAGAVTVGASPLSHQFGIPIAVIVTASRPALLVTARVLSHFLHHGGMPRRWVVIALWLLAAAGLLGLAAVVGARGVPILPLTRRWLFVPAEFACMTAIGAGVAAGYVVQANKLGRLRAASSPRRRSRPGSSRSPADEAAGLAQRWSLISGVVSYALLGQSMARFGVALSFAGLAVAISVLAAAVLLWRPGFPRHEAGVGKGGFWAIARQSREVEIDVRDTFVLYGAWGLVPALLAYLGAGPSTQASIAAIAQLTAALLVGWLGQLAGRDRRRIAVLGGSCATVGVLVLALLGSAAGWIPSGSGVIAAEVGFNAVGGTLKGGLASTGDDRVRQLLAGYQARFMGTGLAVLGVTCLWYFFTSAPSIQRATDRAIGLAVVLPVIVVLSGRLKHMLRPGKHMTESAGNGVLYVILPALAPGATQHWSLIGIPETPIRDVADGHGTNRRRGWRWYGLDGGETVSVERVVVSASQNPEAARSEYRILELRNVARPGRRCHVRGDTWAPLTGPPGPLERGTPIIAVSRGVGRRVGRLVRYSRHPVRVQGRVLAHPDLMPWLGTELRRQLAEHPRMRADVDPDGPVVLYRLTSLALRTDPREPRDKLRIRPNVRSRRRSAA